ncbi:MAG TPA: hypothetical protein VN747_01225 [Burkholderiales bacterium]|jgi:hypothetical protein|nr:hypothetical protein [Burkholderiales bacterium]
MSGGARRVGGARRALAGVALAAWLAAPAALLAQAETPRSLELEDGKRIDYLLRTHPADAHLVKPATVLAPTTALDAARLLNLHLSTGDIEEAALLSNSPRRRFEVLQDYRRTIGDDEFRRVFAEYFDPKNKLLAEVVIGPHSMLVWNQANTSTLAGQFFVKMDDGRYLVDDIPNPVRTSLRQVLDAYRAGKIPQ